MKLNKINISISQYGSCASPANIHAGGEVGSQVAQCKPLMLKLCNKSSIASPTIQ